MSSSADFESRASSTSGASFPLERSRRAATTAPNTSAPLTCSAMRGLGPSSACRESALRTACASTGGSAPDGARRPKGSMTERHDDQELSELVGRLEDAHRVDHVPDAAHAPDPGEQPPDLALVDLAAQLDAAIRREHLERTRVRDGAP